MFPFFAIHFIGYKCGVQIVGFTVIVVIALIVLQLIGVIPMHFNLPFMIVYFTVFLFQSIFLIFYELRKLEIEKNLIETNSKFEVLINNVPLGVLMLSEEHEIIQKNSVIDAWFPNALSEGKCYNQLVSLTDEKSCENCSLQDVFKTGKTLESVNQFKTALGVREFNCKMTPLLNEANRVYAVIETLEDVTERNEARRQLLERQEILNELSYTDALTQIPNRRSFDEKLALMWSLAKSNRSPVSLIMIDIDYFKIFNDTYGHQEGDRCLKQVAQVLNSRTMRHTDVVARYGGEEFACILFNTIYEGAREVAEKFRSSIEFLRIPNQGSPLNQILTVSLGVATVVPERDQPAEELIKASDEALYRAKNFGRNQVQ
ncbi:sensor domain-containing diguanylate cyclase [Fusibacter tunisiensis]|uniref:sensor domain-containing diguanylate cyclase n=1 Tax=Fusibacter tunisiensis TaxID=1008308 RepID=UPI00311C95B0